MSGSTFTFNPSYAEFVLEAYARIKLRAPALDVSHLVEARRSLNILLQAWANDGVNLWALTQYVLPLVTGQITPYALPANTVDVLDVYYNLANGDGTTTDRYMTPISRQNYAEYPNKYTPGTPTVYWFDRMLSPTMTIWQPEQYTPPNTVTINYMARISDVGATLTGDLPPRFFDALCSDLAWRLARKYPAGLVPGEMADIKQEKVEAWALATKEDREAVPLSIRPDLSGYWTD